MTDFTQLCRVLCAQDEKTAQNLAKENKHKSINKMLKEWQPSESLVNKVHIDNDMSLSLSRINKN